MKRLTIYVALGCAAFLIAFHAKARQIQSTVRKPPPSADAPDSVQLAAMGFHSGPQLVVYVFGGSRCGFCQKAETKEAIANVRATLGSKYAATGRYRSVRLIGVAVNTDIREGLKYLESMGPAVFDEISVGSGWQNEHVIRRLRQERIAEPGMPLVIVVQRHMTATLAPLKLEYSADSVVKVVQGAEEIARWVRAGAELAAAKPPLGAVHD
jgi:hypothetical protein